MKLLKIAVLVLVTVLIPLFCGYPLCSREDRKTYRLLPAWCAGWAVMYTVSYITGLAGIALKMSLTALTAIWCVSMAALTAGSALLMRRRGDHILAGLTASFHEASLFELAASIMVAGHALVTFFLMHIDDDDIAYVGAVTTSVDTNSLMKYDAVTGRLLHSLKTNEMMRLVTAPLFSFYAVVSKLTGIRPAPLCHSILPPVFTVLFFAAMLLIASELFREEPHSRRKCGLFLCFAVLIAACSYVSVYTAGTFIMVRSWQGKSQAVGFVLPVLLYLYLRILRKGDMMREDLLLLILTFASVCLLTTMGAMLAALTGGILAAACAFRLRKVSILLKTAAAELVPLSSLVLYLYLSR